MKFETYGETCDGRGCKVLANERATRAAPVDEVRGLLNSFGYSQGGTAKFLAALCLSGPLHSLHTLCTLGDVRSLETRNRATWAG